jgi:putative FmdB family regulatory protein
MPLYDYECLICGKVFEEYREVQFRNYVNCCGVRAAKLISKPGFARDTHLRDEAGQSVWFPKDGGTYFDRALQKQFNSKKEKVEYMKANKIVMDGSVDLQKKPIEAGDNRFVKVR